MYGGGVVLNGKHVFPEKIANLISEMLQLLDQVHFMLKCWILN